MQFLAASLVSPIDPGGDEVKKKCTIQIPLNPRGASKIKMLTDGVIVFKKKVIL